MPSLQRGLFPMPDPPQGAQLGSAFALRCARRIQTVRINGKVFGLQGLAAHVAAAKQATRVTVEATSTLEAAQAGFLLAQCCSATQVSLRGSFMPAVLPPNTTALNVTFEHPADCAGDPLQHSALICHAALLPQLRELELRLCSSGRPAAVLLSSPIQLHCLRTLEVGPIRVSAATVDLSWLQHQPCARLKIAIKADTRDAAKHAAVVGQLSKLVLGALSLDMRVRFTSELQDLWSRLKVDRFWLDMGVRTSRQLPLQSLPRCSEFFLTQMSVKGPVYISWQALTRHPAKMVICLLWKVYVLGAGSSSVPDLLHQPWQLQIHCAPHVPHGLPASLKLNPTATCEGLLQNAAARAAGWTTWKGWCLYD